MTNQRFRSSNLLLAVVSLLVASPLGLRAQEGVDNAIRLSRQGLTFNARALGMGNAYSVVGYDYAALRMNPATLGFAERATYTMSVNTNAFLYGSDFYGTSGGFSTTNTVLNQAGLTFPIRLDSTRTMTIGLGYTQDKDFNAGAQYQGYNGGSNSFVNRLAGSPTSAGRDIGLTFPVYDDAGRYLEDRTVLTGDFDEYGYILDGGNLLHFTGGVALEAAEGVHFGVSASYNLGTYRSDREFKATDSRNAYGDSLRTIPGDPRTVGFQSTEYRDIRSTTYKGWDARLGLAYRFENFIGIGIAVKIPFPQNVTEEKYLSGSSLFANGTVLSVDPVPVTSYYQLQPPFELTAAAMVNLWFLTGSAEATYVDYSEMEVTAGYDVPDRSDFNKRIKEEFTRVLNLNIGAEFRLPFTGLIARAGAMYRPSPFKGEPSRYDQKFVTLGFGINSADRLRFDIGYLYGWKDQNQDEVQTAADQSVDQRVEYHDVLITATFGF